MPPLDEFRAILRPNEPLAPLTWFRLGGPAAYYARPRSVEELVSLSRRCREEEIPVRVLAGGSNVLVRDDGVPGLVIHLENPAFSDVSIQGDRIESGAAVPITALISQAARAGLGGLEILTGLPGTVGGALRTNAGTRQGSIGGFIRRVTVLDNDGEVQVRDQDDLSFGHRWSNLDEPVILSAEFQLAPEDPEAVVRRMRRVWIVKKESQPYGHQSTGCIFKNPTNDSSVGLIIEQAGLKGAKVGGAEVSERHANFIVAHPGAASADVLALIDRIREEVDRKFGLELTLQLEVW
jgi:UDP-N-acetylmuramate dehydrogenase